MTFTRQQEKPLLQLNLISGEGGEGANRMRLFQKRRSIVNIYRVLQRRSQRPLPQSLCRSSLFCSRSADFISLLARTITLHRDQFSFVQSEEWHDTRAMGWAGLCSIQIRAFYPGDICEIARSHSFRCGI